MPIISGEFNPIKQALQSLEWLADQDRQIRLNGLNAPSEEWVPQWLRGRRLISPIEWKSIMDSPTPVGGMHQLIGGLGKGAKLAAPSVAMVSSHLLFDPKAGRVSQGVIDGVKGAVKMIQSLYSKTGRQLDPSLLVKDIEPLLTKMVMNEKGKMVQKNFSIPKLDSEAFALAMEKGLEMDDAQFLKYIGEPEGQFVKDLGKRIKAPKEVVGELTNAEGETTKLVDKLADAAPTIEQQLVNAPAQQKAVEQAQRVLQTPMPTPSALALLARPGAMANRLNQYARGEDTIPGLARALGFSPSTLRDKRSNMANLIREAEDNPIGLEQAFNNFSRAIPKVRLEDKFRILKEMGEPPALKSWLQGNSPSKVLERTGTPKDELMGMAQEFFRRAFKKEVD